MIADARPDWLKKTVEGLQGSEKYEIFLESPHFAIIVRPGHTAYIDRMSGCRYAPTRYTLVEKGKNYWSNTWEEVHTGRMTNVVKADLVARLKAKAKE